MAYLTSHSDVVGLNLAQCSVAHENLYFASEARVRRTLDDFEKKRATLRVDPPEMVETPTQTEGRTGILLGMERPSPRLKLPKVVAIRSAAKTGRYALGNAFVRDPIRVAAVRAELDRLHKLRQAATERADRAARNKDPEVSPPRHRSCQPKGGRFSISFAKVLTRRGPYFFDTEPPPCPVMNLSLAAE